MGEDAETQGRLHRGDKLRTWKVTRLSGEVRGVGGLGTADLWGDTRVHAVSALRGVRLLPHPAGLWLVLFACGCVHALPSLRVAAVVRCGTSVWSSVWQ